MDAPRFRRATIASALSLLSLTTSCGDPVAETRVVGTSNDAAAAKVTWPPVVGEMFPDLTMLDHRGKEVALSSFKGKVLLIEPIGMTCPACVAFNGGHVHGALQGVAPQADLRSVDHYLKSWGEGTSIHDPDLCVVQLLFFSMSMQTPTVADARAWAEHFRIEDKPNHYVLIGPAPLRATTRPKIPGYWLVDRQFRLVVDAAGNGSPQNLYRDLLRAVPGLLQRGD